eukprot:TRINITY_DN2640_c2_g1_i2.p1 TRINITY_DN2640_c2_g1~~TRINITY_DN2640_c2_g1_i2.p1  ORF type:complete len:884 (+),score=242.81 TRINITY_DN2640_c2_g1_i2:150-2801(+)
MARGGASPAARRTGSGPLVPLSEVTDRLRRNFDSRVIHSVWSLFRDCDSSRSWALDDHAARTRFFASVLGPGREEDAAAIAADCCAAGEVGLDAVCRRLCRDEDLRSALTAAMPPPASVGGAPRTGRGAARPAAQRTRYVRLTPTAARDGGSIVQLGALELFGPGGEVLRAARVTAVGARRTHVDGPQNVLLASGRRYRGCVHQPLLVELSVPSTVEGYRLQTADAADFDATEWSLEVSAMPAGPWQLAHAVRWRPRRGLARQADGHGLVAFRLSKQGEPQYDLHNGTPLELLQSDGQWERVMLRGGLVGWVKSRNIEPDEDALADSAGAVPLLSEQRWQWAGPFVVWTPPQRRLALLDQEEECARGALVGSCVQQLGELVDCCGRGEVEAEWVESCGSGLLLLEKGLRTAREQEWQRSLWLEQRQAAGALAEVVARGLPALCAAGGADLLSPRAQPLPKAPAEAQAQEAVAADALSAVRCLHLILRLQPEGAPPVPLPQGLVEAAGRLRGAASPLLAALGRRQQPWPPPQLLGAASWAPAAAGCGGGSESEPPKSPDSSWTREQLDWSGDESAPREEPQQLRGVSGRCSGSISTPAAAERVARLLSQLYYDKYPHGCCDVFGEVAANLRCSRDTVSQAARDLHVDCRQALTDAGLSSTGPAGALVLVFYTCEGKDIQRMLDLRRCPQAVWCEVNSALRSAVARDRLVRRQAARELRRWAGFVSVLLTLRSEGRRPWHGAATYRGLAGLPASALRHCLGLGQGAWLCWPAAASTTLDEGVANRDYHQQGKRAVTFEIRGVASGIEAWRVSAYPKEKEVLLPPFAALRVERPANARGDDGRKTIGVVALGALGDGCPAITGFSPETDADFAEWLKIVRQSVLQQ